MTSELVSLAHAVLVPTVTAVVGAMVLQVQDWQRRRSRVVRSREALDDAGKQVAFVSQWWGAASAVTDSPEELAQLRGRARQWLDKAAGLALESEPARPDQPGAGTARRLLLLVPLTHDAARRLRVVYLAFLGVWVVTLGRETTGTFVPGVGFVSGDLVLAVTFAVVAILLRFTIVSIEGSARPGAPPRRSPQTVLLLYPLRRWWPRTVRVLFWALTVATLVFLGYAAAEVSRHPVALPFRLAEAIVLIGYCAGLSAWVTAAAPPPAAARSPRAGAWLLLYPFTTRRGMVARAGFHVALVFSVFIVGAVASDLVQGADDTVIGVDILIVSALGAAVLRKLALASEPSVSGPVSRSILDKLLLIYTLDSKTAKITRVLYHLAALFLLGEALTALTHFAGPATIEAHVDLPGTGIAAAVSGALWTGTVLVNRRRTAMVQNHGQTSTPQRPSGADNHRPGDRERP